MIPPLPFQLPELFRHAVELDRRVAELRALTGMDEVSAHQWFLVLQGLQATRRAETLDSAWRDFRWAIMEGATPVAAAAHVADRMLRRSAGV